MKPVTRLITLAIVFLVISPTPSEASEFPVPQCEVLTMNVALYADMERYYLMGKCESGPLFTLGLNYSRSSKRYREVIKVYSMGASAIYGVCDTSPVTTDSPCLVLHRMDMTGGIHAVHGGPLADDLLGTEQLEEIKGQFAHILRDRLSKQSKVRAMEIPKNATSEKPPVDFLVFSVADLKKRGVLFNLISPEQDGKYPVAPPLEFMVPERVDVQMRINMCGDPSSQQCDQHDTTIPATSLVCSEQETNCRFEGGLDAPMKANRHYMLIIRPLPLKYDPIVIEFDMTGIPDAPATKMRMKSNN